MRKERKANTFGSITEQRDPIPTIQLRVETRGRSRTV
jgi:hypothetical protein